MKDYVFVILILKIKILFRISIFEFRILTQLS